MRRSKTTSPLIWCGRSAPCARSLFGVVVEVGGQQALGFAQADVLALRVIGNLFLRDTADHEVLAAWVTEVPARHCRRRVHREVLGEGRSEEHTSELQSLMRISYAVFCLKQKIQRNRTTR